MPHHTTTVFLSASSALLLHTPLGSLLQRFNFPSSPVDPSSWPSSSKSTLHTGDRFSNFDTSCATCITCPGCPSSASCCLLLPLMLDRAPARPAPIPEGEFLNPAAPFSTAL